MRSQRIKPGLARRSVGYGALLIGVLVTMRVAWLGVWFWESMGEVNQLRCYVSVLVFPALAVLGVGLARGYMAMLRATIAAVVLASVLACSFGRL